MLQRNKMYRIINKIPETYSMGNKTPYKSRVQHHLKENTMFDFTKQTKQYEELAERVKEVNEFWIDFVISSLKQLVKTK
jgi:hypothetical protein